MNKAPLTLTTGCVIAGAWYDGNLVYDHGIRVKKARLPEDAPRQEQPTRPETGWTLIVKHSLPLSRARRAA